MKIILEYNPESGELKDANGVVPAFYNGLNGFNAVERKDKSAFSVSELIKLKKAGFTAKELAEMEAQRE